MAGQINNVLCYFAKVNSFVKLKLLIFISYCSSLYGSVLWDLSKSCIESVCSTWRRGLRRVFGLPYNAHCALLAPMSCSLPTIDELCKRTLLFAQNCLSSECKLVRTVASHAVYNSSPMQSPLGRNIVLICLRYHVNIDSFAQLRSRDVCNSVWSKVDDDIFATANMLLELISVRCGYFNFTHNDMTQHK